MGLKRKSNIVKAARISMFVQHANFPECWGCWGGALDCLLRQGRGSKWPLLLLSSLVSSILRLHLSINASGRCSIKIWKIFKTFAIRGRSGSVFIWQNPSVLEYYWLHSVGDLEGNTEGVFSSGCLWRVGASLYLRYKQSPVESTSSQFSHLGMFVLV